jgi:hypothetical protein
VAALAVRSHEEEVAARLLGATERFREQLAIPIWESGRVKRDDVIDRIKKARGDECYALHRPEGRGLSFERACSEALTFLTRAGAIETSKVKESPTVR